MESIKQMEGYANPTVLNGTAGNSAPVGGKRHHKLKLVTKKAARKALKKLGMKLRGGATDAPVVVADAKTDLPAVVPKMGGRRTRKAASRRSASRKSIFGL
jgi:hypothetical protein